MTNKQDMESTTFQTLEQLEGGIPSDKLIRLKSVFKAGKTTLQPVRDQTGWYTGVPRLSDEDKKKLIHWSEPESKYTIKDGTVFDLNDPVQKITWDWVKHAPCIAMSEEECQFTPGAEFYVYLENKEAEKSVTKRELKVKAMQLVMDDNSVNYNMRVKLLGINMDGESQIVLKDYLLEQAEKDFKKVIDIYESHDVSARILLMKAKEKNVVTIGAGGIYRYGNNVLGMTENSAVSWLTDRENKHLVEVLEPRSFDVVEFDLKKNEVIQIEDYQLKSLVIETVSSGYKVHHMHFFKPEIKEQRAVEIHATEWSL